MKTRLLDLFWILLGNTIYAFGIVLFVLPAKLVIGGTTGIGLTLEHYLNIPLSTFVFIFNISMFIIGYLILGKKFAMTTLVSTFCYPVILHFLQLHITTELTNDIFINTFFGGILIGIGLGMVIKRGASTGGMDIPPLILNKLFKIPVGTAMYAFDFLILLTQMTFSSIDLLLYGIVITMIYTYVLDKYLIIGSQKIELTIVSSKSKEIQKEIQSQLDRGLTILHGKTGYLQNETEVIISVMNPRDVILLERKIHTIDEEAFIIVNQVKEVKGRGFSIDKKYLETPSEAC